MKLKHDVMNFDKVSGSRPLSSFLNAEGLFSSNGKAWEDLIRERRERPAVADELFVETVVEHQRRWGAGDKAAENAGVLHHKDTFCVCAGQQPGLLLGPLYTLFKALSAVALAETIERERPGIRVVPIFWNASDDSDLEEINKICISDRQGAPSCFEMGMGQFQEGTMIGSLGTDALDFEALKEWLEESFFETEFLPGVFELLEETYRESTRLAEWFNRLLHGLTDTGLVIYDSALYPMKQIARSLWRPYMEQPGLLHNLLEEQNGELAEQGLKPRVEKWAEDTGWFLVDEDRRHPISMKQGRLFAAEREIHIDELLDDPNIDFKPSAALRPILQDMLFPNLATIVGPNELEYHAQLEPIYRYHGVFRPKVLLRFSGVIMERKVSQFIQENGLDYPEMSKSIRELEKELFRQGPGQRLEEWSERASRQLGELFEQLAPIVSELGEEASAPYEKKRRQIEKDLSSLEDVLVRRMSQKDDVNKSRLEKAKSLLFPDGRWQERAVTPLYFLSKYGPEFIEELAEAIRDGFSEEPRFSVLTIE